MNYRSLALLCHCGEVPDRIAEVGFSEDHNLVIHWWCGKCQKVVYVTKPLSDCWRECPSPNYSLERLLPTISRESYEKQDAEFLRSIGVQA